MAITWAYSKLLIQHSIVPHHVKRYEFLLIIKRRTILQTAWINRSSRLFERNLPSRFAARSIPTVRPLASSWLWCEQWWQRVRVPVITRQKEVVVFSLVKDSNKLATLRRTMKQTRARAILRAARCLSTLAASPRVGN